jgi:hypothetical protein
VSTVGPDASAHDYYSSRRGPYQTLRDVYDALESNNPVLAAHAGAQWVADHALGALERDWQHNTLTPEDAKTVAIEIVAAIDILHTQLAACPPKLR